MVFASFDYAVPSTLPKSQCKECFRQLIKSFSDRGGVGKDVRSIFTVCYVEFVDDWRYVYIDDSGRGPEVEDLITFLSQCPELDRLRHTKKMFKKCFLCVSHWTINVPYAGLGSQSGNVISPELSSVVHPLPYYVIPLSQKCSFCEVENQLVDVVSC